MQDFKANINFVLVFITDNYFLHTKTTNGHFELIGILIAPRHHRINK